MTVYDVYTNEVGGERVPEPRLLTTFNSFVAVTAYLEQYVQNCTNPLAMSFYKSSIDRFIHGKSETFGIGKKRYCKVRKI